MRDSTYSAVVFPDFRSSQSGHAADGMKGALERLMPGIGSLLIVDDNEDLVSTCGEFLEGSGFRVLKAFSGAQAVDMCDHDPDSVKLAIIDLNMPEVDGPATIEALKRRMPGLQVVAISGAPLIPYFTLLNDLGVRFFLPKPFFLDGLLDSVRTAMSPASAQAA
jgi:two-component system cell cycle sensor histidine kinase/response regulator CckA